MWPILRHERIMMLDCSLNSFIVLPVVPNIYLIRSNSLCLASVGSRRWIRFVCAQFKRKVGVVFWVFMFFYFKKGSGIIGL